MQRRKCLNFRRENYTSQHFKIHCRLHKAWIGKYRRRETRQRLKKVQIVDTNNDNLQTRLEGGGVLGAGTVYYCLALMTTLI